MTGAAFLLLALALTVAVVDWIAVSRDNRPLEYVCKPLTMLLLIGVTLALDPSDALGASGDAVRAWFVVALVLCLLGDVLLMVPRDLFVFGLAAFLLGHIAYVVGLHVDGVTAPRFLVGIVVVMAAIAVLGTLILRSVRSGPDPGLAGPVVAYMFVISAMVASAVGVGRWVGIAGAVSFYVSDAIIAWDRFKEKVPHARVAIMVTYHLGQVGLVLSLA
ncbi:MAG: lysoplasmalogenase [Acidimicrobiales bacterium]